MGPSFEEQNPSSLQYFLDLIRGDSREESEMNILMGSGSYQQGFDEYLAEKNSKSNTQALSDLTNTWSQATGKNQQDPTKKTKNSSSEEGIIIDDDEEKASANDKFGVKVTNEV